MKGRDTINDLSVNGNNGVIIGDPTWSEDVYNQ